MGSDAIKNPFQKVIYYFYRDFTVTVASSYMVYKTYNQLITIFVN